MGPLLVAELGQVRVVVAAAAVACGALLAAGCSPSSSQTAAPVPVAPPFKITASVQELMQSIVDPSADGVWDSVGTTVTQKGVDRHQPKSEEEWQQVRLRALALIEATNLLMMDGRRLVPEGGKIADEGADGVLTTPEGEAKLKAEHATFVQMARALNEAGGEMLKAIDARQPDAMLEVGETMDEVCEACHVQFWYPRQPTWTIRQGAAASAAVPEKKK